MPRSTITTLLACLLLFAAHAARAEDWSSTLKNAAGTALGGQAGVAGLSTDEMSGGLKEALAVGAERAIRGLGKSGGYLDDAKVRIPLPGKLKDLEGTLRMLGQGAAVDEFTTTVNRAAEQAIPKAAPIVGDAIRGMSIADAKKILTGPDDAATRYFRDKSSAALIEAMLPVVRGATDKAGVTRAYKDMIGKAGPAAGMLGSSVDVDRYVTEEALDGLFLKLAEQEKRIRTNPAARSSDLLKKVFGAAQR